MLTRLTVVIISQYIQILNHYAICLKLIECYMSILSQLKFFKNCPRLKHCLVHFEERNDT